MKRIERKWMYERLDDRKKIRIEFVNVVDNFVEIAKQQQSYRVDKVIKCPCVVCKNTSQLHETTVRHHLYANGFHLTDSMGSETGDEYAKFEEKVKRTVYLDNLSPAVTKAVIQSAFNQYGDVVNIHFYPNYTEPHCNSNCALVELKEMKQAKSILDMLCSYPFMMSGMPRPVRGLPAKPEMFEDRPSRPGRRMQLRWLDPKDPEFEVAQKLKRLAKKHADEQSYLQQKQQDDEDDLSKKQNNALKGVYQKFDMMDCLFADGTAQHLAKRYGVHIADD